jgi:hypothetical protein
MRSRLPDERGPARVRRLWPPQGREVGTERYNAHWGEPDT